MVVRRVIDLKSYADVDAAAQALLGYGQVRTSPGGNRYINRNPPEAFYGILTAAQPAPITIDLSQTISAVSAFAPTLFQSDQPSNGAPYLYCTSMRVRGMAPISQVGPPSPTGPSSTSIANWKQARLNLEYRSLPYNILTDAEMIARGYTMRAPQVEPYQTRAAALATNTIDATCPDESWLSRYVIRRPVPAAQYLSMRGGMFSWVPSHAAVKQGTGRMIVHINLMFTWVNVPIDGIPCGAINPAIALGAGAVENALGRVNQWPFAGAGAGTLLFMAVEFKSLRNRFGIRTFDVTYAFKWMGPGTETITSAALTRIGHNHAIRPETNLWTQISTDGTDNTVLMANSKSPYDWRDFRPLFRPP